MTLKVNVRVTYPPDCNIVIGSSCNIHRPSRLLKAALTAATVAWPKIDKPGFLKYMCDDM